MLTALCGLCSLALSHTAVAEPLGSSGTVWRSQYLHLEWSFSVHILGHEGKNALKWRGVSAEVVIGGGCGAGGTGCKA